MKRPIYAKGARRHGPSDKIREVIHPQGDGQILPYEGSYLHTNGAS